MNSVVYFVQSADGPIKIGWTADLSKRFSALRSISPVPLTLVAKVSGGYDLEQHIHERLAEARLHSEWFAPTEAVLDLISAVKAHGEDYFPAGFKSVPAIENNSFQTAVTAEEVYRNASARIIEMVEGEKDRCGCLERGIFEVIRRVPDLTRSSIHKLRRGYPIKIEAHVWLNLVNAHRAWLPEYERHLNSRRQAINALARNACDQAFYQGRTPELDHSPPAHHRLADQKDEGA